MSVAKTPPLPVILMANNLLDGEVVFLGSSGWSRRLQDALIAQDAAYAQVLLAQGMSSFAQREVVDVYLVDVTLDAAGRPIPRHYREKMRCLGPSNRLDLGKQAVLS